MSIFHACSFIGSREEQQDRYMVLENVVAPGDLLAIVCDGHMRDGVWCAKTACQLLAGDISAVDPFIVSDVVRLFWDHT